MSLDWQSFVRRDISPTLIHWTKPRVVNNGFFEDYEETPAFNVLIEIIKSSHIKGSSRYIKGSFNCVCFTESPLSEMISIFNYAFNPETINFIKYHPFGIGFPKSFIYSKGGRPVIYQDDPEYDLLPNPLKWRHCRFNPINGIDFTWEREWRIKTDSLELDSAKMTIFVPNPQYKELIDTDPEINQVFKKAIFPLSIYGLKYSI